MKKLRDEFDIVFFMGYIVIPNFKSHNIIMSARIYFMKTVNGFKDVSIMSSQDVLYTAIFMLYLVQPYTVKT